MHKFPALAGSNAKKMAPWVMDSHAILGLYTGKFTGNHVFFTIKLIGLKPVKMFPSSLIL